MIKNDFRRPFLFPRQRASEKSELFRLYNQGVL